MDWDRIEGNWKQYMVSARQRWDGITEDELDIIAGRRDTLAGQIQEVYRISRDEAVKQVEAWQAQQKETS